MSRINETGDDEREFEALRRDMEARWVPSPEQDGKAAARLRELAELGATRSPVFSVQVLPGKPEQDGWSAGVEVIALPVTCASQWDAESTARGARAMYAHLNPGTPVGASYIRHTRGEYIARGREWETTWTIHEVM